MAAAAPPSKDAISAFWRSRYEEATLLAATLRSTPTSPPVSTPRTASEDAVSTIWSRYQEAALITPPSSLAPIFVSREQTEESRRNLAISFAAMPLFVREGWQLFEIPPIDDDCATYCERGYSPDTTPIPVICRPNLDPAKGWVKLEDTTDFSCRRGFEKVYVYGSEDHFGRQWGDGTILEKFGLTDHGATSVGRFTDPHHPFLLTLYRRVTAIWIREYGQDVPHPFFRFQSVYSRGPCPGSRSHASLDEVKADAVTDWEPIFKSLQEAAARLAKASA